MRIEGPANSTSFITDSKINGNTSDLAGGDIVKDSPALSVTNSEINGNTTGGVGGAILTNSSSVAFNSTRKFNNNTATSGGLADASNGATVVLIGATHTGNSAPACENVTCY